MKNLLRNSLLITALLVYCFHSAPALAAIDITPTWVGYNNAGAGNSGRTSSQGFTDQYVISYDSAGVAQQYPIFNIGTSWIGTSVTGPITSATLTFPEAYRMLSGAGTYSVFEVPGTPGYPDYSKTTINNFNGAGYNGSELYDWSGAHTKYGLVTKPQLDATGPVSFDITALLEGWRNGSLTTNPGWMMILVNDLSHDSGAAFGAASGNPTMNGTITVNVAAVPEPGTMVVWGLAILGLLCGGKHLGKFIS